MRIIWKYIIINLFLLLSGTVVLFAENDIQLGFGQVSIELNGPCINNLNSASIFALTSPIYIDFFENETFKLDRQGETNVFSGKIPLDLKEEVVGFQTELDSITFGFLATLYQNKPIEIKIKLNENNEPTDFLSNDTIGPSPQEFQLLNQIDFRFYSSHHNVQDSLYTSWNKVREYEENEMFPLELKEAFENDSIPIDIPEWFINSLKARFASIQTVPYVKSAETINGLKVEEPPMESYSFLDNIDFSDKFLKRLPYTGLKSFLYALLRFPEGGFNKIGETPMKEWQDYANNKLLPAISNPTKLLLDLLAGMSYVEQIEIDRIPLTEKQIRNIVHGFDNDLGIIILNKNNTLIKQNDSKESQLYDLSATTFNIKKYIDKMYPGQPVLVDLWNTWCSPCIDGISKTEPIRESFSDTDIIFIFVSDESSPLDKWKSLAKNFGGIQIRINEDDSRELGKEFNLTGFPSYLLYDRNHDLVSTFTGIPLEKDYLQWLELLNISSVKSGFKI